LNKDNSGALFHNPKVEGKQPNYSGECMVNGVKMQIAGWKNTSSKGTPYLSLKFQPAGERKSKSDEDIPF